MANYSNKEDRLDVIKEAIKAGRTDLHPTDHAEACRELEIFCQKEADAQEASNDANGVPERR